MFAATGSVKSPMVSGCCFLSAQILPQRCKQFIWYNVRSRLCGAKKLTYTIQIDRHNHYRQLSGLVFPHHATPSYSLGNTIVDGELVIDVDPRTRQVRTINSQCLPKLNHSFRRKPSD